MNQFQYKPIWVYIVRCSRGIKGWSRRKKEALINGDFDLLPMLSKRGPADKSI